MTWRILALLVLFPGILFSQMFQKEIDGIEVMQNGRTLAIPWNGGLNTASIALGDLDNDSDVDLLFTGGDESRLQFYRNDGEGETGTFELADAALDEIQLEDNNNRLALHDLDSDGDLDLFVGENNGRLTYFRNDGGVASPMFVFVTAFFDSIDVGDISAPAFGDLNGDGRADLVIGSFREGLFYFTRTTGGAREFAFVDTLRDDSGALIQPGTQFYVPHLVDIDDDGDLDLFVGASDLGLFFYRNNGDVDSPQFAEESTPFLPAIERRFITPAFTDIDDDGDPDLFFASNSGFVSLFRNDGGPANPNFTVVTRQIDLAFLDFGFFSVPSFVDIDADGDFDLISGNTEGDLSFLRNIGSSMAPRFEWVTSEYQSVRILGGSIPTWGDLDNDGDTDLLSGAIVGGQRRVLHYENIGSPQNATLDSVGVLVDTAGVEVEGRRVELGDLDGDTDLDLLVSRLLPGGLNALFLYENVGSPGMMTFAPPSDTLRDSSGNAILHFDIFFRLVDFDLNGTLDLLIGNSDGDIVYYVNIGTPGSFAFAREINAFAEVKTGTNNRNAPFAADIDGDSDLDLFAGRFQGGLFFFRQVEEVTSVGSEPADIKTFRLSQNYPNPFNPSTTIRFTLEQAGQVELRVFNARGQEVRTLLDGWRTTGDYQVAWDGTDNRGKALASGVYFYRLLGDGVSETRKMLLLQ